MRQFAHATLSLPIPSKLRASASFKQTTAVCTPPKRLYRLHWSPSSGLPSAIQSAATTSSLVMVSSRSLTSTDLFGTKDSLQDLSVGLTALLCHPDSVARPGGRGTPWNLFYTLNLTRSRFIYWNNFVNFLCTCHSELTDSEWYFSDN